MRTYALIVALAAATVTACGDPVTGSPEPLLNKGGKGGSGSGGSTTFSATPLIDTNGVKYLGTFEGGLYAGDQDTMPSSHRTAGLPFAQAITPLDAGGLPSASGAIVLVSIGISNTRNEFCQDKSATDAAVCDSYSFIGKAASDPEVNQTTLRIVNGAQGSQPASAWVTPTAVVWDTINVRLAAQGLTEQQVQVAWLKHANQGPTKALPGKQADAYTLESNLGSIVRAAKQRWPNLKLVFVSSRIYAGYSTKPDGGGNPEPYAYEGGFAVKWLIDAQITQAQTGKADAEARDLNYTTGVAPWLAWGPYLWANSAEVRSDGLVWLAEDFTSDGVHPSPSGVAKVADMLMAFFKTSPHTRCWFLAAAPACS